MKKNLIPMVASLAELKARAEHDPRYARLMLVAASNLGGSARDTANTDAAYRYLCLNAAEVDEPSTVAEVNYCRDLIND